MSSFHPPSMPPLTKYAHITPGEERDLIDSWFISRGFVPQEMEDKWFVYMDHDRLIFRRSWTGIPIYDVEAQWRGERLYLGGARVNRDPEQYLETDDAHDAALLRFLIDAVLCGKDAPFPAASGPASAQSAWAQAGSASPK